MNWLLEWVRFSHLLVAVHSRLAANGPHICSLGLKEAHSNRYTGADLEVSLLGG